MDADAHPKLTPDRLEAFSDGVIAVIITIMVLELKVPARSGLAGMQTILPTLLVYGLSFVFTGIYWVNHHVLIDRVEEIDSRVLYTNLLFLFSLSLLPFFTSWVIDKGRDTPSVLLYTVLQLAIGSAYLLLRLAVERLREQTGAHTQAETVERQKHWRSLVLLMSAVPVCFWRPTVALLLTALVNLVWVLPGLGVQRHMNKIAATPQR